MDYITNDLLHLITPINICATTLAFFPPGCVPVVDSITNVE